MTKLSIGILGSGTLAQALGSAWVHAGHVVTVGGRSREKSERLARQIGAVAADPAGAARGHDAVLLAVLWPGVKEMLTLAGGPSGTLAEVPLIDPTNPVEHGIGELLTERSAAEHVADLARGAHVVKAFNVLPATRWTTPERSSEQTTVAVCGDDQAALVVASRLVRDVGATPAVLGGLKRARQLEEVAGFAIKLAFSGVSPVTALPSGVA